MNEPRFAPRLRPTNRHALKQIKRGSPQRAMKRLARMMRIPYVDGRGDDHAVK